MKPDMLESLREQYPPDGMADNVIFWISIGVCCGFILGAHFLCGMPILR